MAYKLKCIWSEFFVRIISPFLYVNKSIVNVKVLLNKNDVVMFVPLKTTQFLSRNGQDAGTSSIVQFHPVT